MKKYLALILALVLVAGLFACGTKEPQNGTDTPSTSSDPASPSSSEPTNDVEPFIGVTIFNYSNNFVGYIRNGVDYYIKNELGGIKYLMVDGENDQATQTERIDTMISKGVNALAVNMVDSTAADTIIAKAKEADLPVIFFNRMPTMEMLNSYDKCWYVGLNSINEGKLQAQIMIDAWTKDQAKYDVNGDGKLQYVMLKGAAGQSDTTERAEGFYAEVEKNGIPVEELGTEIANWSTTEAKEVMETWIGKYGDKIEMVICQNDAMALGAVEALKGNGLISDKSVVPVIGINALPEVAEQIKAGNMLGTVLTSTYDSARAIIDMCINAINGREITEGTEWTLEDGKIVRIPETMITIDNIDVAVDAYKAASK